MRGDNVGMTTANLLAVFLFKFEESLDVWLV
jgi:hypothetical protein